MKILSKLYNIFFISKYEKKLYTRYKTTSDNRKGKKTILIQCVEDYFYFGLFGEVVSYLKTKKHFNVELYTARCLTLGSSSSWAGFLKSILLNNRLRDNKWINLYKSYCDNIAFRLEGSTNIIFDIKAFFKARQLFNKIETKNDVIEIIIDDLNVGELIYDSYLRFKSAATVNPNDMYLLIVIWQAIRNKYVAENYFKNNKVEFVLNSYSTYIQHGITAKVALNYNIPVYTFGNYQNLYKKISLEDFYHTASFHNYKINFQKFNDIPSLLSLSKNGLEKRVNGIQDTATSYMKKSAYKITNENIPNITNHIIIFLHDFFDSPHIYGKMVFHDFLEWIEFTIDILEKENINFSVKPHPNQIEDSEKTLEKLLKKYPNLNIIPSDITNKQLVDAGISGGVSVYGTVAHEVSYMGLPVILCAENPHSSYSFCFEAKTIDEYTNMLKNFKNLKLPINTKEEVESFYYMHNLNKNSNDIILLDVIGKFREVSKIDKEDLQYEFFINYVNLIRNNNAFSQNLEKLL